ncbi:MAG: hypothetical protein ACHQ7H_23020, partial [Candidatus Rokuibacteriota bacterium]
SWPRTQFPDGSGSIAMPPGWRLNSARQAAAELQGPRGEAVAVGITMPIGPPQFASPGSLAAPYMPPAEAYVWVSEVVARRTGGSAQARIVEMVSTPPLTQNARAVYLLADQVTQGRRYRAFALVNTAMLGNGYWQYYMTLLTAPAEIFPPALPLMTEVWQSWSISQGEMNRRTAQAMLTMQETSRIMQSTAEGRRTTEWHQRLTGMTLQGRWVIEDTTTGQRLERSQPEINALFEQFPGRYRVVPSDQLK